jgi:hypothetical protein
VLEHTISRPYSSASATLAGSLITTPSKSNIDDVEPSSRLQVFITVESESGIIKEIITSPAVVAVFVQLTPVDDVKSTLEIFNKSKSKYDT